MKNFSAHLIRPYYNSKEQKKPRTGTKFNRIIIFLFDVDYPSRVLTIPFLVNSSNTDRDFVLGKKNDFTFP